jgi:hypothetical protein
MFWHVESSKVGDTHNVLNALLNVHEIDRVAIYAIVRRSIRGSVPNHCKYTALYADITTQKYEIWYSRPNKIVQRTESQNKAVVSTTRRLSRRRRRGWLALRALAFYEYALKTHMQESMY